MKNEFRPLYIIQGITIAVLILMVILSLLRFLPVGGITPGNSPKLPGPSGFNPTRQQVSISTLGPQTARISTPGSFATFSSTGAFGGGAREVRAYTISRAVWSSWHLQWLVEQAIHLLQPYVKGFDFILTEKEICIR